MRIHRRQLVEIEHTFDYKRGLRQVQSRQPTDRAHTSAAALRSAPSAWRTVAITLSLGTDLLDVFGQRTKPDRATAHVDVPGVGSWERIEHTVVVPIDLGAVLLRLSLPT
jgi:hypothetical protein